MSEEYIYTSSDKARSKNKKVRNLFILLVMVLGALFLFVLTNVVKFGIVLHNKAKYRDSEFVQQDIMNYLEDRYGEEFVMESYTGRGYSYNNYVQMYAYPKGREESRYKFQVQGYYNKKGEMEYFDTYVYQKLKEEYEERLDPYIAEYFDEYKYYLEYNVEWVNSNLPADITLDEMLEEGGYYRPRLYIYIKPGIPMDQSKVKIICENLRKDQMRMDVVFWLVEDEELYKEMDRDDINKFWSYKTRYEVLEIAIYMDEIKCWHGGEKVLWD